MSGKLLKITRHCVIIDMVVGMIYNYSELLKKKSRKEIETLVLNKKLYKLETGIYSDTLVGDDLVVYSKKYKSSIVTIMI